MRMRGPSYGEVVHTSIRIQAPLGGGKSPTSRCPKAVDWNMGVCVLQGVRTLVPEEGVAYIECARTPAVPRYRVQCTLRQGLLVTSTIKCY